MQQQPHEWMVYPKVVQGTFLSRPNQFMAWVEVAGEKVLCHINTTGRCKELLLPGARVLLNQPPKADRKTELDLVAAYKGDMLVNIDSQMPNRLARAWLERRYPDSLLRREVLVGNSRMDFALEDEAGRRLVEVKGCTLEVNGLGLFPDAPTMRGLKHLHTLCEFARQGSPGLVLFIAQMQQVRAVAPFDAMHPAFGQALREAVALGVEAAACSCEVSEAGIRLSQDIPVQS